MSDYERNKGWLIATGKTFDEMFNVLGGTEYNLDIYTKEEYVREYAIDRGFEVIGDKIYKVNFEVEGETGCPEFADVKEHEDGSISFHTYHYNGVAHWTELVEDSMKSK